MTDTDAKRVKQTIASSLEQAKLEGKLRTERVREIVREAVSEAMGEIKEGSDETGSLMRDALYTVVTGLKDQSENIKDNVQSSIEGGLEAINLVRRKRLEQAEKQAKALQAEIEAGETELQTEIDDVLIALQENTDTLDDKTQSIVKDVLNNVKDTEEVQLMQKRYAQLRTQLAVLRANLSARYGDKFEDIQQYIDEAKAWYERVSPQLEEASETVQAKEANFQKQLASAGKSLAKKGENIKQTLKELWNSSRDALNK